MTTQIIVPDDINFSKYMLETEPVAKVRSADEFREETIADIIGSNEPKHPMLPFRHAFLEFRPGEVTVWGGFNNSGKSLLQGQVAMTIASHGERVCIASFEMKPKKTLHRMLRQACWKRIPDAEDVARFFDWSRQKLWLYDQQGTVKPEQIVAVIRYCAREIGIKHVCVDSLMKCVRGEDDYNGQKNMVDELTAIARDEDIHIHLVHHMRKGEGDEKMPTRSDLRGSASISDQVDNVLILWRNKPKERQIQDGVERVRDSDGKEVSIHQLPDAILICDKQRNGDWQESVRLWYHKDSTQFIDSLHGSLPDLLTKGM